MPYNIQSLQAALKDAQANGDQPSVTALQQAIDQQSSAPDAPQAQPQNLPPATPTDYATAFYRAKAAGDEPAAMALMGAIQQSGQHLRPMNADEMSGADTAAGQDAANSLGATGRFTAGAGKAFEDTGRGIAQLGALGGSFLPGSLGDWSQGKYDALKQGQTDDNAAAQPLMNTTAGRLGNIGGNVAMMLAPVGALKGASLLGAGATSADMLGLLAPTTLRALATQGAAIGAAQPLTADQGEGSRLLNTAVGAGTGVAAKAIPSVIGAGAGAVRGLLDPLTDSGQARIIANTISRFGRGGNIAFRDSAVPGVQSSLGTGTGNQGIAALQNVVADSDPSIAADFSRRAAQNNGQRLSLLGDVAGTPDSLARAVNARDAQAAQMYGQAATSDAARQAAAKDAGNQAKELELQKYGGLFRNEPSTVAAANAISDSVQAPSATLTKLAQRPVMQSALKQAVTLAKNNGVELADPLNSVQGLHYTKLALDDMLNVGAQQGIGNTEKAAITGTKKALLGEIGKISPDYMAAKDAYSAASGPINAMQAGQDLLDRATTNTVDQFGNKVLTPGKYANAINNLDTIAQNATGNKNATAQSVFSPEHMGKLQSLLGDLNAENLTANAGKSNGSNTVKNLASQSLLGNVTGALGLPGLADSGLLSRIVKPIDIVHKAFGTNEELQKKLASVLLDPTSPASQAVLKRLTPAQRSTFAAHVAPYLNGVGQSSRLSVSQ